MKKLTSLLFVALLLAAGITPLPSLAQERQDLQKVTRQYDQILSRQNQIFRELERIRVEQSKSPPPTPISSESIQDLPEHLRILWYHATSTQRALTEEARIKYDWMLQTTTNLEKTLERAKAVSNPAEAAVLLKEARHKAELAERLTNLFLGPPAGGQQPFSGPGAAGKSGPGTSESLAKPRPDPLPGLFQQMTRHEEWSQRAGKEHDPKAIRARTEQAFGEGRAGAGGISLHTSAKLLSPLPSGQIRGARFDGSRLVLDLQTRVLAFPPLNPDYLALALRCVSGGEGTVKGKLLADEVNAVVIQTGKIQFGDVVWKKDFLPDPWKPVSKGEPLQLLLGPAIGLMDQPDPSTYRVTYYGPIKDTRMGKVLLEADLFLATLLTGVHWETGRPLPLPHIDRYMSGLEQQVRRALNPPPQSTEPTGKAGEEKPWWWGSVTFVWVPDEFSLRETPDGKGLEFAETRMKLVAWSMNELQVSPEDRALAEFATRHYQALARSFPALSELVEVAKAVTVARWLHEQKIPVELSWAKGWKLSQVPTPAHVRGFTVRWIPDSSGKPTIERRKE